MLPLGFLSPRSHLTNVAGYTRNASSRYPFPANYPGFVPNGAFTFQRDLRTPYLQHWNLGLQRALWQSAALEIVYAGSKGTKLINSRDVNQAQPSPRQPNFRPNPMFLDISVYESRGNSSYHSMQAKFTQRLSRGFSALGSYTRSKSIDDASGFFSSAGDPNFPQDSNNVSGDRGLSNFDVRHRFTLSYTYDLPLGSKNVLLRGWQTAGLWTFQTGRPFTVTLLPGVDNSNTGIPSIGFGVVDRPNVSGDPRLSSPGPVVQHRRLRNAGLRDVRQCGQKHPGGSRVLLGKCIGDQGHDVARRPEPPVPRRNLQPSRPREFRPSGRLLRVSKFWTAGLGRRPAKSAIRAQAAVLSSCVPW